MKKESSYQPALDVMNVVACIAVIAMHVNGAVYCGDILSNNYGTGWSLASDGTYSYRKGVSGTFQWAVKSDFITYNYTLEVVNGIVVKMTYI